jgi:hypothetical protein
MSTISWWGNFGIGTTRSNILRLFFEFVAQIGREMTERKSLLIRKLWKPEGGKKHSQRNLNYWNGLFFFSISKIIYKYLYKADNGPCCPDGLVLTNVLLLYEQLTYSRQDISWCSRLPFCEYTWSNRTHYTLKRDKQKKGTWKLGQKCFFFILFF